VSVRDARAAAKTAGQGYDVSSFLPRGIHRPSADVGTCYVDAVITASNILGRSVTDEHEQQVDL